MNGDLRKSKMELLELNSAPQASINEFNYTLILKVDFLLINEFKFCFFFVLFHKYSLLKCLFYLMLKIKLQKVTILFNTDEDAHFFTQNTKISLRKWR